MFIFIRDKEETNVYDICLWYAFRGLSTRVHHKEYFLNEKREERERERERECACVRKCFRLIDIFVFISALLLTLRGK